MTNYELAEKCRNVKGCYKCPKEIKSECLKNDCWKQERIKDRKCPAVFYKSLLEK